MSFSSMSRRHRALVECAPVSEKSVRDRAMRVALYRARKNKHSAEEFSRQQTFDRAVTDLASTIPIPNHVAEWFVNEQLIPVGKPTWKKIALNPAVLAVALALAVIAGVFAYRVHERMHDFPGAETARKLLTIASSTRSLVLDPVKTDAGALGDLFFMKHRLEHYDVPAEFADFRTLGCRVFDDDEAHRVAQIWVVEKRMQFFLFPAEKNPNEGRAADFSDWRYVEQEGWIGAVQQRNGVCFMAAIRGKEKDLASYLAKPKQ